MESVNEQFSHQLHRSVLIFLGVVIALYGISSFFPNSFLWGVNHLAFLSPVHRLIMLTAAITLGVLPISRRYLGALDRWLSSRSLTRMEVYIVLFVIGVIGTFICYRFRIITDLYGDSRTLLSLLSGKVYAIPDLFNPKDTEPLTRYIHQMAANVFHIDQKVAYEIISAIGGGLFLLFYLLFVLRLEGSVSWKILLVILGLSGGANQLFFGHVEDYTLVYVCSILFLIAGWQLFEGNATLGTMIVLFVVGVRLHVQMVLLAPALLYAVLHHRRRLSPKFERWIEPKRLFAGVALSVVCATLAYFFYFHADRYLVNDQAERFQKVFLPLVNPLPPPHYYTLFSIGHLSDVAQEFLLTVSPVAIMVLWLVIKFYRRVDWRQPRIMFFGLAVFYFQLFNLTVNPLLTMERDWDMLSLAAAPAMFLAIALSHQLFEKKLSSAEWATTTGVALAGAVLSCTIFYLNTTEQCVGSRFLGIGKWAFRSYYQGSSYLINVGEGMISDKDEQIARGDKTIRELLPDASMPDFELANLYHKMGNLLYARKQFIRASYYYGKGLDNDQSSATATKAIVRIALQLRQFDDASRIISYYNESANQPTVIDFDGLALAQRCNYFRYLQSIGTDSASIQKELDHFYETGQ